MNTISPLKIGLVGTGMVGSSFAYSLMQSGIASELVLVDANAARAEGEAMDLSHGVVFTKPIKIYAADYSALAGCAVTVITAGAAQKPGETRLQLLEKNAGIFRSIVAEVMKFNPEGLIVIATNPVDLLTKYTLQLSGLPTNRVIGSGTTLDSARLRYFVGTHYGVDPHSVQAYIVGEHGDSSLPLWSAATIGGVPMKSFVSPSGVGYDEKVLEELFVKSRDAAYTIIEKKMATYYAIGLGLVSIVEAIVREQHTVLTVSSLLNEVHGVSDVCISLPCVVGKNGIESVLSIPMTDKELILFQTSAKTLKERYSTLG
jgi:L-lactate dehydrogenase